MIGLKSITAAAFVLTASVAQAERLQFSISVGGFPVGTIETNGTVKGNQYSATGKMRTSGLVSMIRSFKYDGKVRGSVRGDTFMPKSYSEQFDTGSRVSNVAMSYSNGVPRVDKYVPKRAPRPYDIKASAQKGTVDVLTGAYATLRDVKAENLCNKTIKMFDGRRRTNISLKKPKISGDGATCSGIFSRIAGYPADDLAKQKHFPFTLSYTKRGDVYSLQEFTTQSTLGKVRAKRR